MKKWLLISWILGGIALGAAANTSPKGVTATGNGRIYYVDAAMRVSGNGLSRNSAFKTIQEAADRAQAGDIVEIAGGIYRETVIVNAKGTPGKKILFRAKSGDEKDKVVISGTDLLRLAWGRDAQRSARSKSGKVTGNVWVAKTRKLHLQGGNQLFVDGRMQFVAQWPDRVGAGKSLNKATLAELCIDPSFSTTQKGTTKTKVVDANLPKGMNLAGAVFNYAGSAGWSGWYGMIYGATPDGFLMEDASTSTAEQVKMYDGGNTGRNYYISNALDLLNVPGEWYYDQRTAKLYLCLDRNETPARKLIEVKTRTKGLEFGKNAAYVTFENIDLSAANLSFQPGSSHCVVDRMKATYLNYEHWRVSQTPSAVYLNGTSNAIWNSEIAYTYRGGVVAYGSGNMVINCYLHEINYGFSGGGVFSPYGNNAVFYRNTAHNVTRSMVGGSGWGGRIAYNHLYDCGWLTRDCGLIYFGTCDGGGMEIDHNVLHDNRTRENAQGIYFDCGSYNFTIHHNVMYGLNTYGLSINVPSPNMLVFNNTIYDSRGSMNDWGWAKVEDYKQDQHGSYFLNNIMDYTHKRGADYMDTDSDLKFFTLSKTGRKNSQSQLINEKKDAKYQGLFKDAENHDFTLMPFETSDLTRRAYNGGTLIEGVIEEGNAYIGAYNPLLPAWTAGCTTDGAGNPDPTGPKALDRNEVIFRDANTGEIEIDLTRPQTDIQYLNKVYNSCFENEVSRSVEGKSYLLPDGWTLKYTSWSADGVAAIAPVTSSVSTMHFGDTGNGGKGGKEEARSGKYAIRLNRNGSGICQLVEGLKRHTPYVVSVQVQLEKPGQKLAFGVRNPGTDAVIKESVVTNHNNGVWKRYEIEVNTGAGQALTVFMESRADGGWVAVENVVVQDSRPLVMLQK